MRIGRLGLVGLAMLVAACDKDEQKEPPRFRVGGAVAGLAGNITLQLNGGERLTRDTNGPFSFETALEDQSDFTVAVAAAPEEQDCAVEGGTGKVAGADVTSVRVNCARRTYTLGGTVEGLAGTLELRLEGGEVLRVTQEGRFTFSTKLPRGGTYAVSVATLPPNQRCTVSNGSGTVAGNVEGISVRCTHWYTLETFQAAGVVIGQEDFTSSAPHRGGSVGPDTLDGPWGNPALAGGRLYVSDQFSNRLLGFNGVPTANGAGAAFVLGQSDFTTTAYGSGQGSLDTPAGVSSDATRLAVADKGNSRVILHTALPATTGAQPALVIGQPSFDSAIPECDQQSLNNPEDVFIGRGMLIVADSANNRVLVWNSLPTTNGAKADLVLGQSSFTTCVENDADGNGAPDSTPAASTLWNPTGVWSDGNRLVVADNYNHRVLIWNQFPTTNGQPADVVLGQTSFVSRTLARTATGMNKPYSITSTGLQLFVADHQNHRVLGWNQFPTTSGASADFVLGQPNFTSANQYDPPTGGAPSARSLYKPSGVLLAWPHLVVTDTGNNRFLVFESR